MNKNNYYTRPVLYDFFIEPLMGDLRAILSSIMSKDNARRILDVGCGTGSTLKYLEPLKAQLFGIDYSPAMLKRAQSKFQRPVFLLQADASRSPFRSEIFDIIVTTMVLHEINPEKRKNILKELFRILQPQGKIYILEYSPKVPPRWKARFLKRMIHIIEFLAGKEHFRNFKEFTGNGGIPNLIKEMRLQIERKWHFASGNLIFYRLIKTDEFSILAEK